MMVFIRQELVMLSVPKTGTHSYIDHLQGNADIVFKHPQNLKHMGVRKFTKKVLPLIANQETKFEYFAFIRHPADWLWSWYSYRARPGIANRPSSTANIDFSTFIREYLTPNPPEFAKIGTQSTLVTSNEAPFVVDNLFKYGNQDEANRFLSSKIGVNVSPNKVLNKSPEIVKVIHPSDIQLLEKERPREFELYESAR
ncbi:hypothetical protein E4191_07510 [Paracoccus liaowanqingii]|uniref:Sulfotransferase family protein n=1 Tax=Paracoccus liaowanqingii TaxID=2560053 RepID=A0A4P7HLR8_9RHOB|nr:sulfotransferase family 2 domain-containing protein [Paracoccus liaowanqingii]QBX34573.1 hypothetical protein E4191_07510 [Paracoccus liaowanqingii]